LKIEDNDEQGGKEEETWSSPFLACLTEQLEQGNGNKGLSYKHKTKSYNLEKKVKGK